MVEHPHQISVLLKELDGLVLVKQVCHYLPEDWCKFKSMARTRGNYQNVLVLVCPVDQEVLAFCHCVVAFLNLSELLKLPLEVLFHENLDFIHFDLQKLFLICELLLDFRIMAVDSKLKAIPFDIR